MNAMPREAGELSCPQEVKDQLAAYGSSLGRIMGGDLVGAYLYGSIARGCYHPGTSDIDVLVVLSKVPSEDVLRQVSQLHRETSLPIDATFVLQDSVSNPQFPASVEFFIKPNQDGGIIRAPEGSGHVLLQHQDVWEVGVPLVGPPVRDVFRSVPWPLVDASLVYVFPHIREHFKNPVLSLARIVSAHTYRSLCSKRQGGEWALRRLSEKWHPLIKMDLDGYAKGETGLDAEPSGILGFEKYCSDYISGVSRREDAVEYRLVLRKGDADPKALATCSVMSNKWPEKLPEDVDFFEGELQILDAKRHFLIAAYSGMELLGFSRFKIMEHDGNWWCMGLHVEPEWRRRGIGTRLLTTSLEHCRSIGVSEVLSNTSPDNAASRGTHEKAGFECVGTQGYYCGEWREHEIFYRWQNRSTPVHVRKARIEESQSIIDLHVDTVRRVNSKDYSDDQIALWLGKRQVEITRGMVANGDFYVAVDDRDQLFGLGHMKDNTISGLYVSADHQGEGVGSALLSRMEADAVANGAEGMEIESTITAASFYQQMGYEEIGRKKVGKAGLDVVVMRKGLKSPTS